MTLNVLDHARAYIKEALSNPADFVDASAVAAAVKALFPHIDTPILTNAIIEETIARGGSVAWGGPVATNQNALADPPAHDDHILAFRSQGSQLGIAANSNAPTNAAVTD